MKKLLTFFLFLAIISCEESPKKKEVKPVEAPKKEVKIEEKVAPVKKKVDNTLVKLQKKPCSGDCPVFDVTITKDSVLTYNGKQYTNIEGTHTVKLSAKQFDKISKILEDSNFASLNSRYTKSGTKDFSESIITHKGKKVTVRLWKDAPKKLTAVYVFMEDILYDQKYLE